MGRLLADPPGRGQRRCQHGLQRSIDVGSAAGLVVLLRRSRTGLQRCGYRVSRVGDGRFDRYARTVRLRLMQVKPVWKRVIRRVENENVEPELL